MFSAAVAPVSEILEGLNEEQRAAVTHVGGPVLIVAGAGTGKTRTLTSRCAWLVVEGVAPGGILLLTFTRRASAEMVARAKMLLGSNVIGSVRGGTFHAIGHQLIRMHSAVLGLPPRFAVFDASDAADLLDLVREERGLVSKKERLPRKGTLLDIYSRCVNTQQPLSTVVAESFPWCEQHVEKLADLFRCYGERKRELGVLDLDDLLLYWHALACHETVGAKLGRLFEHILVDEYQDLNALQVEIVRALRRERRDLTVVGDDQQAIYAFRGASAEHILNFGEHFPDATMVTLERNYRSSQPILDLANEVSAGAARAYPKRLHADREGGSLPQLVYCRDPAQQATEVCERVLAAYEEGMPLCEQAVLMRAGHHSDLLELELGRRKIPFAKFGGIRYLDAAHVKDFVCVLRLADNPADQLSWFRVIQLPEGIGPVSARRALDALDLPTLDNATQLGERWQTAVEPLLKAPARQSAAPLIQTLTESSGERNVGLVVERLREAVAPLIRAHYPDGAVRLRDLDQLTNAAAHASSLNGFLTDLALDPPSSSADYAGPPHLDDDYLTLSTVHSAKGLEWDAVHVINVSDGDFPSDMALSNPEGLEEERRLFYVALTRARQRLTVYVPVRYYHHPTGRDDAHGYGKQSRFLTDQADALCETINAHTTDQRSQPAVAASPVKVQVDLANLWR